jgi:hypothetical protein
MHNSCYPQVLITIVLIVAHQDLLQSAAHTMVHETQPVRDRSRSRDPSEGTQPILKVLPPDSRNWMVLEIAPRQDSEHAPVLKLTITLPNGVKKTLDLVRQTRTMKVYVNPDPQGCDEWEVGNQTWYVMTDPRPAADRDAPDPRAEAATRYWEEI